MYCALVFLVLLGQTSGFFNVFNKGEAGYFCIKIPDIVELHSGKLLAFGEARKYSCSDFTWTDLVMKSSTDGGSTWSPLRIVHSNSTDRNHHNVIGNAAPVQLASGKLVVPFCRNNFEVYVTYSTDEGETWTTPKNITNSTKLPEWSWIGTGPPASIILSPSNRIVTASYHTYLPDNDGELSYGHMMLSDDDGETWYLGGLLDKYKTHLTNEEQAVDLGNNTVFVNARGWGTHRLTTVSHDGGKTFSSVKESNLPSPYSGCEGSTIKKKNYLLYSGPSPNPAHFTVLRFNMTIWRSDNKGESWYPQLVVNAGPSGYSALANLKNGSVGLLFENWKDPYEPAPVPDHISYVSLDV